MITDAAIIERLDRIEALLERRGLAVADGVYQYGPCLRCGYGPWDSYKQAEPRCCPRCHSAYWSTPPRRSFARTPTAPPNPNWETGRRVRQRIAGGPRLPTLDSTTRVLVRAEPALTLPPELRPPGEDALPPPPKLADVGVTLSEQLAERTMPTPHAAALPDAVVERILSTGEGVTYDEIKAARDTGVESQVPARPAVDPPAIAEKKAAFFAGFAIPEEPVAAEPSAPFVAPSLGDTVPNVVRKDDPFWK